MTSSSDKFRPQIYLLKFGGNRFVRRWMVISVVQLLDRLHPVEKSKPSGILTSRLILYAGHLTVERPQTQCEPLQVIRFDETGAQVVLVVSLSDDMRTVIPSCGRLGSDDRLRQADLIR